MMFKSTHLGTSFPELAACSHAFEYLRDIVDVAMLCRTHGHKSNTEP
jgi:hypothetical protein